MFGKKKVQPLPWNSPEDFGKGGCVYCSCPDPGHFVMHKKNDPKLNPSGVDPRRKRR